MLTALQYASAVFNAERANAVLIGNLRAKEALGCYPNWNTAMCQGLKIKSGFWSLNMEDYSSVPSVDIYNQLLVIGSSWFGGIAFDPNAQLPGNTIILGGVESDFTQSERIPFTANTTLTISNWPTNYWPTYGDNPEIQVFTLDSEDGQYKEDTNTVPTYVYPGNDFTQRLDSIVWTWPIVTTGYYVISGKKPNSSSGGTYVPPPQALLPITNLSTDLLSDAELNALYSFAQWGQLILLPNVPAKYEKLDNSPTGQWDLQTYTPNT
jgi:hypothetical protein